MTDKISTLVLNVDLDCDPCYKKIKKALCKFREIQSQSFDEKQKKVIISGPFDPEKLIKKLYCKVGCKIIKGYEIPKPPPPPKDKPDDPPKDKTAPPKDKPADPPKDQPADPPKDQPAPTPPPKDQPADPPKDQPAPTPPPKPQPPAPVPVNILIGPVGPGCYCRPFRLPDCPVPVDCTCRLPNPTCRCKSRGSHGYCQCGGRYESGCHFFSDEDKDCKMM